MKMKNIFKKLVFGLAITSIIVSCHDDLNQSPIDPDSFTEEDVFATPEQAKGALAKLYSSLALTGQQGPAGQPDIAELMKVFLSFRECLLT